MIRKESKAWLAAAAVAHAHWGEGFLCTTIKTLCGFDGDKRKISNELADKMLDRIAKAMNVTRDRLGYKGAYDDDELFWSDDDELFWSDESVIEDREARVTTACLFAVIAADEERGAR